MYTTPAQTNHVKKEARILPKLSIDPRALLKVAVVFTYYDLKP